MNILFVHQNFPGQFKFLAPALAARGHKVLATTLQRVSASKWQGIELIPYEVTRGTSANIHPWVADFETKIIRAEACFRAALRLKERGFTPDAIIAHHGWGESLFLKEVWPHAKLGIYCEFHYASQGADYGFDPEFPPADQADVCRLQVKNINNLFQFQSADAAISPTHWQASTFPESFRSRIKVVHDGIDTRAISPNSSVSLTLNNSIVLTQANEVVTFVNRNLEPYRGYHIFMRSLPKILKARPNAHVLIVGGNDISYGSRPPRHESWKDVFIKEVRPQISEDEWRRVYFLGTVSYEHFTALLQLSTVHVYLTYPFVLSWSLLEAMSTGCAIVASDTKPVKEAINHGVTGRLVDFFNPDALAHEVCNLLDNPALREELGRNARAHAQAHYDLQTVCLPQQIQWVEALTTANAN